MMQDLIQGFLKFKKGVFLPQQELFQRLANVGQTPPYCIISCSDARTDPSIIFSADMGEIFSCRNVAARVPLFCKEHLSLEPAHAELSCTLGAALEFAVLSLKVRHIIVMGHRHCGGVAYLRSLLDVENFKESGPQPGTKAIPQEHSFLTAWMQESAQQVSQFIKADGEELHGIFRDLHAGTRPSQREEMFEKIHVVLSLHNLLTYPFVEEAVSQGLLSIHGLYYDLAQGSLEEWDDAQKAFFPCHG